jgi:rhodanese-related sulfurtransferase
VSSCPRSAIAARHANTLGYTRVQVMSAGIKGWIDAALPTESSAVAR